MAYTSAPLFLLENLAKTATLSHDGAVIADLPIANLADEELAKVFRTTTLSNLTIKADLGSAKTVEIVALIWPNLRAAATWQIRVSNNSDLSAPSYDSGTVAVTGVTDGWDRNVALHLIATAPSGRYVGITLTDAGHPDGYLEVSILGIGSKVQLDDAPVFGIQIHWVDDSQAIETPLGKLHHDVRPVYRLVEMSFINLSDAEAYALMQKLDFALGAVKAFLFVLKPNEQTYWRENVIWGRKATGDEPFTLEYLRQERGIAIRERL